MCHLTLLLSWNQIIRLKTGTHVVIGASVDDRDVNHLGAEIFLNLSNERVYILDSVESAVATAD